MIGHRGVGSGPRGAAVLLALGLALPVALPVRGVAETPAAGPTASCEVVAGPDALEVRCDVAGLDPTEDVVLRVRGAEGAGAGAWVGGGRLDDGGAGRVAVAVPCGVAGAGEAEVVGATADGGRFRHVEPVDLGGACVPDRGWVLVVASVVMAVTIGAVTVVWLRRRVSRARTARRRARRRRGGGRRRSRGRRSRRR